MKVLTSKGIVTALDPNAIALLTEVSDTLDAIAQMPKDQLDLEFLQDIPWKSLMYKVEQVLAQLRAQQTSPSPDDPYPQENIPSAPYPEGV